jgi:hypothetical protein
LSKVAFLEESLAQAQHERDRAEGRVREQRAKFDSETKKLRKERDEAEEAATTAREQVIVVVVGGEEWWG